MNRRHFMEAFAALPLALTAQERPPVKDEVESLTAGETPTLGLNHLGFRPHAGEKILVVRALPSPQPREFTLRDVGSEPFHFTRPVVRVDVKMQAPSPARPPFENPSQ